MREVLRQEKKYLMSYEQFRKLDNTFEKVLHPDPHNGVTGYAVRSLYFDTLQERDFYEEAGWESKKIRLRTYDRYNFCHVEMKQKQGIMKKRSLRVSGDARVVSGQIRMSTGDMRTLFEGECYGLMTMMLYRPKSIVEYQRKLI